MVARLKLKVRLKVQKRIQNISYHNLVIDAALTYVSLLNIFPFDGLGLEGVYMSAGYMEGR